MIVWPVLLLYVYGLLLILGGLMGYLKAKSVPSLIAGVLCGLLAIFLGYNYVWHYSPHEAFLLSLVLIWIMGRRFLRTRKAMPAVPIILLSIVVALAQVFVLGVVSSLGR